MKKVGAKWGIRLRKTAGKCAATNQQPATSNQQPTNEDDKESGTTDRYQYSVSVVTFTLCIIVRKYDFISFIIIRREMLAVLTPYLLRSTYNTESNNFIT